MVTPSEMSAILGGAVAAAPGGNDRPPSSTECIYSSAAGPSPYAELEVDWGGGDEQVVGTAAGMAEGVAPEGAVDPLKGLGDRASSFQRRRSLSWCYGGLTSRWLDRPMSSSIDWRTW